MGELLERLKAGRFDQIRDKYLRGVIGQKDFSHMTLEELEEAQQALMHEMSVIREWKKGIQEWIDRRVAEQKIQATIESMSGPEKAALRQVIAPDGIVSGEEFGEF